MAISDKTRKKLWGRSGNCCAICRCELVMDASHGLDDESVVGDECHIVARELKGSRGDSPLTTDERDDYTNLILMCKVHHKLIDDQPNAFTVEVLTSIKHQHERWVSERLKPESKTAKKDNELFIVPRIETGQRLLQLVSGSLAYHFDNDNLENEYETELVGDFFQLSEDYLDIWSELESKDRIRAQFQMGQIIQDLEANGFLVYGCQQKEEIKAGNYKEPWFIAYIFVFRKNNPLIARKEEGVESIVGSYSSNEFSNFIWAKQR